MMTRTRLGLCGAAVALWAGTMAAGRPARSQAEIVRPLPTLVSVASGLTTHGHGEVKLAPDLARVSVQVTTRDKYQDKAVQDNARKMTTLLAAVRGLKVADKDVQTQGYSVDPQYDYDAGRTRLAGYQVTNSVQITLRDLTQTGTLIDTVTQAGVNQGVTLGGITYDLADRGAAQDRALTSAVTEARRKAGAMASALGVTLGSPLSLSDTETPAVQPLFQPQSRAMMMAAPATPTPIATQEITLTADVTLVYALGPASPAPYRAGFSGPLAADTDSR